MARPPSLSARFCTSAAKVSEKTLSSSGQLKLQVRVVHMASPAVWAGVSLRCEDRW